ncbi:TetR/AcrR family transcriptional regulator [Candidatus Blastococcus massiliensis]|uniref:TetR/AcrR family transcriptional regulator n=1 Tax=Candidatus Blastococcus massiliensis TaxID=1470358 RepID=UPI0009DD11B6|nr:TetR/AcrR family transcriptional regulator [Candidatus Blastococcus massiliensis]
MPREVGSAPGRSAWKWSRTGETRRVLLDAARQVFAERGFADSSVADVVERAGSSVGSLYHHFGGKSELFLALWEDWQSSQEQRAAEGVAAARRAGEERPLALFVAGARGFLRGSWEGRGVGSLFVDKDGPPGFELMRRTRGHQWLRQNSLLLQAPDDAIGRVSVAVLTTVIGEAGREVMASRTRREAEAIVDAAVEMIERLGVFSDEADPPAAGDAGPEEADPLWAGEAADLPDAGTATAGV